MFGRDMPSCLLVRRLVLSFGGRAANAKLQIKKGAVKKHDLKQRRNDG